MDLKRLRTFVTVAEHGTVSKAAEVLNITQPALSRQIGSLEAEFGFELFERSGRRVLLTPHGEQLLADCRSLLSRAAALSERAQALRRGDIKTLKVAASALTIEVLFPTFLNFHAERMPGVRLGFVEAVAAEHLNVLERGEAHVAVNVINTVPVDDNRFARYALPPFQMLAASSRSMQIDERDADIRQLCELPLLLLSSTHATRMVFDAACQLASVKPNIFGESASPRALLQMAEAGHGIAVVPSILQRDFGRLRLRRVTYRGEPLQLKLAVLWDRQRMLARHANAFSDLLAEHIRDLFPTARRGAEKLTLVR